jgi:hypothetical protein
VIYLVTGSGSHGGHGEPNGRVGGERGRFRMVPPGERLAYPRIKRSLGQQAC